MSCVLLGLFDISAGEQTDRVVELTAPPAVGPLLNDLDQVAQFQTELVVAHSLVVVLGHAFAHNLLLAVIPIVVIF